VGGAGFGGESGFGAGAYGGDAGTGDTGGEPSGATGGDGAQGGSSASGGRGGSSTRGGAGGRGGTGAVDTGGGDAGGTDTGGGTVGGTSGSAGAEAGEGGVGLTGAGGTGSTVPDQLAICVRLDSPTPLSLDTTLAFEKAVIKDCDINWVTSLYYDSSVGFDERSEFLNQLLHFNLDLWGCPGTPAPDSFDLIYKPAPLSAADVVALIDAYVAVSTDLLTLSPGEVSDMRAVLGQLSAPLLIDPDPGDFSDSRCVSAGGAGGEGGTG
jgi:hypothetical protein